MITSESNTPTFPLCLFYTPLLWLRLTSNYVSLPPNLLVLSTSNSPGYDRFRTNPAILMFSERVVTEETPHLSLIRTFSEFRVFVGYFVMSTVCIYVHVSYYFRINSRYFAVGHLQAGLCSGYSVCFTCCSNLITNCCTD